MKNLSILLFALFFCTAGATSAAAGDIETPDPLTITFLSVGQADAILIQQGDMDLLVDTSRSYNDTMQTAMSQVSGPLEYLIITHPHYDHYGGAAGTLENHEVSNVITNGIRRSLVTWAGFESAVADEGLEIEVWEASTTLKLTDHLGLHVLASGGDLTSTSGSHLNNDSLVFVLYYQGRRILFTGDIEESAGQLLVEQHCDTPSFCPALRADVMKIPHHGSASFSEEFFEAVNPFYGVVSAGYNLTYGNHCLPRRDTVTTLSRQGIVLRSTNQSGGQHIVLTINPGGDMVWSSEETNVFVWETRNGDGDFECTPQICDTGLEPVSCSLYE